MKLILRTLMASGALITFAAMSANDNATIYHPIKGRRTEKMRSDARVTRGAWHVPRVDFRGSHFVVIFDGKRAPDWVDETFKAAGMLGGWTKADRVTLFDEFRYGALQP